MPNSQPNSVSGSSSATSNTADCAKSCDNPDPLQFKEGALIAFRCCDGYEFNVIELIKVVPCTRSYTANTHKGKHLDNLLDD